MLLTVFCTKLGLLGRLIHLSVSFFYLLLNLLLHLLDFALTHGRLETLATATSLSGILLGLLIPVAALISGYVLPRLCHVHLLGAFIDALTLLCGLFLKLREVDFAEHL